MFMLVINVRFCGCRVVVLVPVLRWRLLVLNLYGLGSGLSRLRRLLLVLLLLLGVGICLDIALLADGLSVQILHASALGVNVKQILDLARGVIRGSRYGGV